MPRPTKHATPICVGLTVVALIGIAIGFAVEEPLYPIGFVIPTIAYEIYRTEGRSTRWASWALAAVIVALAAVTIFGIEFDLRQLLGSDIAYVGDHNIPLGDLSVVFPAIVAILAVVLWTRTRGIYTRWLAAIIFVTAAAVVYLGAPEALGDLLDSVA